MWGLVDGRRKTKNSAFIGVNLRPLSPPAGKCKDSDNS
jgi:hypothetical protein